MRQRPWQLKARSPEYLLQADMDEAEQTCNNLLTLRAHMLVRHQFGSDIDWHLRLFDDKESTVSLNGQRSVANLAAAYVKTGDEGVCPTMRPACSGRGTGSARYPTTA